MKKKENKIEISRTTDKEIETAQKMMKEKYDIDLPRKDAIKICRLSKELYWWQERTPDNGDCRVSEKDTDEFKELYKKKNDKEISTSEAANSIRALAVFVPFKEKQRLADDMRMILIKNRKIKCDKVLRDKTNDLVLQHYGEKLHKEETEWLLKVIARMLWLHESLDSSVEKCLDDLLKYVDKRKRGKRTLSLDLHDDVRRYIDLAIKELKIKYDINDSLYRNEYEFENISKQSNS